MVHRLPHREEVRGELRLEPGPPADRIQADEHERGRTEDQHDRLHDFGVDDRAQTAEDRVQARDHDQHRGARPDVEPRDGAHNDAAGEQRDADLRQHIADDRHPREVPPRGRIEAPLEELRHRVHAAPQIERHEQPAEQEQHEAGDPLEVAYREPARRAGSREPHEVLAANVGREQTRAYREPTHIAPARK